jgi:hypothetical protein
VTPKLRPLIKAMTDDTIHNYYMTSTRGSAKYRPPHHNGSVSPSSKDHSDKERDLKKDNKKWAVNITESPRNREWDLSVKIKDNHSSHCDSLKLKLLTKTTNPPLRGGGIFLEIDQDAYFRNLFLGM